MDLFLIHSLILLWASLGTARCWLDDTSDQLLAAALLSWGNLVTTSLLLAMFLRLGDPTFFFWASTSFAVLLCVFTNAMHAKHSKTCSSTELGTATCSPWLISGFIITIAPLLVAIIGIAFTYAPNNSDALSHDLPRALYYLGQNSLAHFDAADYRQIYLPFNATLLHLFGLIYHPPLQCLNILNLLAWVISGIATFKACRLLSCSPNASLIACWAMLTAIPVIARATSTTPDLLVVAGMFCSLVFVLKWQQSRHTHNALLAGLALGLTAGTSLIFIILAFACGVLWSIKSSRAGFSKKLVNPQQTIRPWILPVILGLILAVPFVVIDFHGLAQANHHSVNPAFTGHASFIEVGSVIGKAFLPLNVSSPLFILNEQTAGIGLTSVFLMLFAIWCVSRYRHVNAPLICLVWLSLGWIGIAIMLHPWIPLSLGKLVPALLLLMPCLAAAIEKASKYSPAHRYAISSLIFVLIGSNLWSANTYLLKNTNRPLLPLLKSGFVPPALPTLPLLAMHRLSTPSYVNINTDGADESIFPFLVQGKHQRFTSKRETRPSAYNLISRATTSRNLAYNNTVKQSSYVLLPIPNKRTSGVEFLCSFGAGNVTRDYFGIFPQSGQTAPIDGNKNVLITLAQTPGQDTDSDIRRLELDGLNSEDHTRLLVYAQYDAKPDKLLAKFIHSEIAEISIPTPFQHLVFKIIDTTNEQETGSSTLPYLSQSADESKPLDPEEPSNKQSLFVHDLVTSQGTGGIIVEGLLPTEGPFPQWNIPLIRWAKQPEVRIMIPKTDKMSRLQLSFSVRLHVRPKAGLNVILNGQLVRHYRLEGQTVWLDQTLNFKPQMGINIIQFRDAILKNEPDWKDYLERYPDVKNYLLSHKIPLKRGAKQHYENNGKSEGRTLKRRDIQPEAPDSYYFMFRNIRLEGFSQ